LYCPSHIFLPQRVIEKLKQNELMHFKTQSDEQFIISAVENEITKCGRTVYADSIEEVNREFAYLSKHHPDVVFFQV